ncbi:MAG: zinc-binding dehydrogenase [Anaerolineales bacterium]|nr:zinc-binding dehydrogenase [Anaerolineales bacterium]
MKAFILPQTKATLSDVPLPTIKPGEVLVRLKSAAINHHEIWLVENEKDSPPFILGSDGSGVVEAVGEHVTKLKKGDEVIIHPSLHWGEREDAYGDKFVILGWGNNGTFAEAILVREENVFKKPTHLSWDSAAALPLAGLTAYRALFKKADLKADETVLIHGISGGVAVFAMQFALAIGAKVIATSTSDKKLQRAQELGATITINTNNSDWDQKIKEQLGEGGVDLVVDNLGGEFTSRSLGLLRRGGRLVSYGSTANQFSNIDMQDLFWRQLTIIGSTMGSPADFADMLAFVSKHNITPVVDSLHPLEKINEALARQKNSERFGKVVMQIGKQHDTN